MAANGESVRATLALIVTLLAGGPAIAQDRLWDFTSAISASPVPGGPPAKPGEIREIVVSADGSRWIEGRRLTDPELHVSPNAGWHAISAGGRFVAWLEGVPPGFTHWRLGVLDTRAFTLRRLGEVERGTQLVGDPTASRVFLVTREAVTSVGLDLVTHTVGLPPAPGALLDWAVASWGHLYLERYLLGGTRELLVLDAATLSLEHARFFNFGETLSLVPLQQSRAMLATRSSSIGGTPFKEVWDADTLGVIRTLALPQHFDEATDTHIGERVEIRGGLDVRLGTVWSATDGRVLYEAPLGGRRLLEVSRPSVTSPLYVSTCDYIPGPGPGCIPATIEVFSPGGFEWRNVRPAPQLGYPRTVALGTPPPPIGLKAAVAGNVVTLEWDATGYATAFQLEAGFRAGQFLIRHRLGDAQSITIGGVPSGRYYVRVRAANEAGTGPPSPEMVVTVP